jgi:hypothetical protein
MSLIRHVQPSLLLKPAVHGASKEAASSPTKGGPREKGYSETSKVSMLEGRLSLMVSTCCSGWRQSESPLAEVLQALQGVAQPRRLRYFVVAVGIVAEFEGGQEWSVLRDRGSNLLESRVTVNVGSPDRLELRQVRT